MNGFIFVIDDGRITMLRKCIKAIKNKDLNELRCLNYYKALLADYKQRRVSVFAIMSIHRKGFTVNDWTIMGLTKDNYRSYLSRKEYCRMHPLNGHYSHMIDDKLNLKYICTGTELNQYMPEYYYMIDDNGKISSLMDIEYKCNPTCDDVINTLLEKKVLAIKMIDGALGIGFYRAEYKEDKIFLNKNIVSKEEFCIIIENLKNYLITEYLFPHDELAEIYPDTANTIRYLIGKIDGKMHMIASYIRFGSQSSGVVENYNSGGCYAYLMNKDIFQKEIFLI